MGTSAAAEPKRRRTARQLFVIPGDDEFADARSQRANDESGSCGDGVPNAACGQRRGGCNAASSSRTAEHGHVRLGESAPDPAGAAAQ
jgi:hypothetical protein